MGADAVRWATEAPPHEVAMLLAWSHARNADEDDRKQQERLDKQWAAIKAMANGG